MKKIFITGMIPEIAYSKLSESYDVTMNRGEKPLSKDQIVEGIKDKDALLCILSDRIDREIMESNPNLEIIANYGAGFDNIDLMAARENSILVTNTPLVSTVSTAELTFALMLGITRRISEGERLMRSGGFQGWAPMFHLGTQLEGKKLGIIGMGNIGKKVARIAKGFQMEVVYHNRSRMSEFEEKEYSVQYRSLEDLLGESDIVTLHLSYHKSLHHYIGDREIGMMKDSAYLINAARGPLVDEKTLLKALVDKRIAGAALDVFELEPEVTEGLEKLDNVLITPHIGNATIEARTSMAQVASENIIDALEGKVPKNIVRAG
ncbi:2-hydroxyacid dehydrogenase family protein [Gudongella sp. SC589]|uniref:2-hydroxyacid dehydrogenase family protein n=1 Tax=Gudongella sp. SC589 TaxID=3385990 RepID=UPI0039047B48